MQQKHMSTLKKNYSSKQLQRENLIHEAVMDAFSSNAQNVQTVKAALAGAKRVAQTYGMKNILTAITSAEQKFTQGVANPKGAGNTISFILTFSDIMSDFFREMDSWVMQLPAVSQAMEAADDPQNAQKTLAQLLGNQAGTMVAIVQKQFDKSAGGFLKSVARFFKTGRATSSKDALNFVGLSANGAAEDVMNINVAKYKQMLAAAKQVPVVQISQAQPQQNPESGTTQSSQSNASQSTQPSAPAQQAQPAQAAQKSQGNAQTAAKPDAQQATQRDTALQGVVKNRNAFNTQILGTMSNEEIKADLLKIAQALGITL